MNENTTKVLMVISIFNLDIRKYEVYYYTKLGKQKKNIQFFLPLGRGEGG